MELLKYHSQFEQDIVTYYLPDDQLYFSSMPKESIELSKGNKDRYPVIGVADNEVVTFFVLEEKEAVKPYSNHPDAVLLRSFSTNYKHQGQGYARQSLKMLPKFIENHLPHVKRIVLGVNVKNTAARTLYKKCGYIDEGDRVMGSKGEMIVLVYDVVTKYN